MAHSTSLVLELVFIAFLLSICHGQGKFTITRKSEKAVPYDAFSVANLSCSCEGYRAKNDSKICQCYCPEYASTFGFYNGEWACQENTFVRKHAGCDLKFGNEVDSNATAKILSVGSSNSLYVRSFSCAINLAATTFLTCKGSWERLSHSRDTVIRLDLVRKILEDGRNVYFLRIEEAGSLLGRLVRLNINCGLSNSSCLLFKMAGTMTCSVASLPYSSSTQTPTTIPSTFTNPPKLTTQISTTKEIVTTTPVNPGTIRTKSNEQSKGLSTTTIGVITAMATVGLLIVIVILVVCIWKRKRKSRPKVPTPQNKTKNLENDYDDVKAKQQYENSDDNQKNGITYDYAFAGDSSSNENKTNYDFKDRNIHDFMLKMRDQNKSGQSNTQRGSEGRNIDESGDLGYINKELTAVPNSRVKTKAATISTDEDYYVTMLNDDEGYEVPIKDGSAPDTAHRVYQQLKDNNVVSEYQSLDKHTRK